MAGKKTSCRGGVLYATWASSGCRFFRVTFSSFLLYSVSPSLYIFYYDSRTKCVKHGIFISEHRNKHSKKLRIILFVFELNYRVSRHLITFFYFYCYFDAALIYASGTMIDAVLIYASGTMMELHVE